MTPLARVTVHYGGSTRTFEMPIDSCTILEAADVAGVELPSQCRAGICSSCRGRLLAGEVRMHDSFALDPAEIAAGWVLACQSVPSSREIILQFED